MLTEKQLMRMFEKLEKFEETLEPLIFREIGKISMKKYQTQEPLDRIPEASLFNPVNSGDIWGGEGAYCWFKGEYQVPEEYAGKDLYLYPKIGGYEAMMWINGKPYGIFTSKIIVNSHGNHYCNLMKQNVSAGERIQVDLEYYAHHYLKGTHPFANDPRGDFQYTYDQMKVCLKDEEICDFYFDLKTLNQMVRALDENSFRRADILKTYYKVHQIIFYDPENAEEERFRESLRQAAPLLKELLSHQNSDTTPFAGLTGHSHMDTAWLWHQGETLKKCARTYANQMNLMDRYPEYRFIQSSAYHSALIKEHYPELFERIRQRVKEGRYEPNGGVWIECDCNIPSGESMVRQFVWGQKFTREEFDYTSDCFWLPDTFGYSAALPQIMKGCGVKYFLTTKMAWNDTNVFPLDTFYWKGLDGTKVLVHLNRTHTWPGPMSLIEHVVNSSTNSIKEKTVSNMRLISYGFGDGGGGPEFDMVEMAKRVRDLEGVPRTEHMSVSDFMQRLEKSIENPTVYNGELYLEIHRGTLTNQHIIKRNNRLAEIALHNLEYLAVRKAVQEDAVADAARIKPLMGALLKNQFHDILPGTCIARANREAAEEMTEVLQKAEELIEDYFTAQEDYFTVTNTLSFDREDVIYLECPEGKIVEGNYRQQVTQDVYGNRKLAVAGVHIPAFSSVVLHLIPGEPGKEVFVTEEGNTVTTPLMKLTFQEKGYLDSCLDLQENREVRGEGYALNTLLIGEEVSKDWDCWDVDADFECRLKDEAELLSREVISRGAVEYRVRSRFKLTEKSSLTQDMVLYADSKEVRYETLMDWQDDHRFLKAAFDTNIFTDFARQEVQFGYIKRSTGRSTSEEKAKFEVSNHKYTDLSESRYGAALFNDCKYGISVEDSKMRLSLHKGGCRPDDRGDKGEHYCCYAFVPHSGGFAAGNVVCPSYLLNVKPVITCGKQETESLLTVDADHILVETVKPAESEEKAFVLRLYEAEGAFGKAKISLSVKGARAVLTNMLEDEEENLGSAEQLELIFRPFEIKTVKILY